MELELVAAGSPTSSSPFSLLLFSGITWVEADPQLQNRAADAAVPAGATHLQPPSQEQRPKLRWHPAPCLKVSGRGRGGPYGWTLQLTQEVQGEESLALGWDPPRLPFLGCAVSAEQ